MFCRFDDPIIMLKDFAFTSELCHLEDPIITLKDFIQILMCRFEDPTITLFPNAPMDKHHRGVKVVSLVL